MLLWFFVGFAAAALMLRPRSELTREQHIQQRSDRIVAREMKRWRRFVKA